MPQCDVERGKRTPEVCAECENREGCPDMAFMAPATPSSRAAQELARVKAERVRVRELIDKVAAIAGKNVLPLPIVGKLVRMICAEMADAVNAKLEQIKQRGLEWTGPNYHGVAQIDGRLIAEYAESLKVEPPPQTKGDE